MNLPDKLPEGVSVFVAIAVRVDFWTSKIEITHKINQMQFLKVHLEKTWCGYDVRIYPVDSSIKYTKVEPHEAWNEGLTISEFEDYLND